MRLYLEQADFVLSDDKLNDVQRASLRHAIQRAKGAHFTDIDMRRDGQNERHEADWLKHVVEVPPIYLPTPEQAADVSKKYQLRQELRDNTLAEPYASTNSLSEAKRWARIAAKSVLVGYHNTAVVRISVDDRDTQSEVFGVDTLNKIDAPNQSKHASRRRMAAAAGAHYLMIGGRGYTFQHIKSVKKVSPGKWEADTTRGTFTVVGGYESGGASNEWFVYGGERKHFPTSADDTERMVPHIDPTRPIHCKSMVECLKIIENM